MNSPLLQPHARFIALIYALASCIVLASPGDASVALVPEDYATIQAALDDGNADTIMVRDGERDPIVDVRRKVVLRAHPAGGFPPPVAAPRIGTLRVHSSYSSGPRQVVVDGFHIRGRVQLLGCSDVLDLISFQTCRMDSGLVGDNVYLCATVHVNGCVVYGGIDIRPGYSEISMCTFIGGGIRLGGGDGWTVVHDNHVMGPGAVGIDITTSSGSMHINDNVVTGWVDGIVAQSTPGVSLSAARNRITDCSGTAFRASATSPQAFWSGTLSDNEVLRCGGDGLEINEKFTGRIERNRIEEVGGAGIRFRGLTFPWVNGNRIVGAGSHGICQDGGTGRFLTLRDNLVLRVAGDGIRAESGADSVSGNVVGRAGARGMRMAVTSFSDVRSNTVYASAGNGFDLLGTPPDSTANNIAAYGEGCGFSWSGTGTPLLACNDWYQNGGGAACGVSAGASDLQVDPRFCNVATDDVTLQLDSPLADAPGCGRIGALGISCDASTPALVALFAADRVAEGILVRWRLSDRRGEARLERREGTEGAWVRLTESPSIEGDVRVQLDRDPLPDRRYEYRLILESGGSVIVLGTLEVGIAASSPFGLTGIAPNPGNRRFEITFSLPAKFPVRVEVFDLLGRKQATLAEGDWPAGTHEIAWSTDRVQPGLYLVRYRYPGGEQTRRLVLTR